MSDFNSQGLANAAWASATSDQNDVSLFAALATAAEQRMGDFTYQNLANTAWAFATASQSDASLFAALATAAEQRMGDFIWPFGSSHLQTREFHKVNNGGGSESPRL